MTCLGWAWKRQPSGMSIDVNIFNEQSNIADKELFSNFGIGEVAKIFWQ
jgi:hypothetical protein